MAEFVEEYVDAPIGKIQLWRGGQRPAARVPALGRR